MQLKDINAINGSKEGSGDLGSFCLEKKDFVAEKKAAGKKSMSDSSYRTQLFTIWFGGKTKKKGGKSIWKSGIWNSAYRAPGEGARMKGTTGRCIATTPGERMVTGESRTATKKA